MSKNDKLIIERIEVPPSRYVPLDEVDPGDVAGKVLLFGTLFVLGLVLGILWLGKGHGLAW
jgi:hypothetical protein